MKLEFVVLDEAEADISEAYRWYENRQERLGVSFVRQVESVFKTIHDHPEFYQIRYPHVRIAFI